MQITNTLSILWMIGLYGSSFSFMRGMFHRHSPRNFQGMVRLKATLPSNDSPTSRKDYSGRKNTTLSQDNVSSKGLPDPTNTSLFIKPMSENDFDNFDNETEKSIRDIQELGKRLEQLFGSQIHDSDHTRNEYWKGGDEMDDDDFDNDFVEHIEKIKQQNKNKNTDKTPSTSKTESSTSKTESSTSKTASSTSKTATKRSTSSQNRKKVSKILKDANFDTDEKKEEDEDPRANRAYTEEELAAARQFQEDIQNSLGIRVFIRKSDDDNTDPSTPSSSSAKSENFEILKNPPYSFDDVGGYQNVKEEMLQSVDMLKNYEKYSKFNVRTPKGMILEGPPGNGKTLLARAFSGEVNSSFIAVSGSQFQEKYVGVGASRIRELFELASKNTPCVIFLDEIDALGRSRSINEVSTNTEREQTLNELLVALDGFKSSNGIFVIGATNRMDLLDEALIRPGRIDKKIYIGNPDAKTREAILDIHIAGKPRERDITVNDLVDITNGLSGAQIENLLNEAMLYALRDKREVMTKNDIEHILGRLYVGYQPNENTFSDDMIMRIAVHEMGHAIVGLMSPHHSKLVKVCLNLWSPTSPGYTIFEHAETDSSIYTKEKLMARLMVLLAGRIAEEIFYGNSITSGASKDIEEAYRLAETMILKFGMGKKTVYAHSSDSSKEFIDRDIERIIESAYQTAYVIVSESVEIIRTSSKELVASKLLLPDQILKVLHQHHISLKQSED